MTPVQQHGHHYSKPFANMISHKRVDSMIGSVRDGDTLAALTPHRTCMPVDIQHACELKCNVGIWILQRCVQVVENRGGRRLCLLRLLTCCDSKAYKCIVERRVLNLVNELLQRSKASHHIPYFNAGRMPCWAGIKQHLSVSAIRASS